MRLFIAIQLNDRIRTSLDEVQRCLIRQGVHGNFTPPDNLHLTLAFIGEYPDPDDVMQALEAVSFQPFSLGLEGFGSFGDLWWAGLSDSGAGERVADSAHQRLQLSGI